MSENWPFSSPSNDTSENLFSHDLAHNTPEVTFEDIQLLSAQFQEFRQTMGEIKTQIADLDHRLDHMVKYYQNRVDGLSQTISRIERNLKLQFEQTTDGFQNTAQRIKTLEENEQKTQGLIGKYQQTITAFESRLLQMKKFISEQQIQLLSNHSLLKKASHLFEEKKDLHPPKKDEKNPSN